MTLGYRIAFLRELHGITQEQLAQKTYMSRSRISLYEIDKREPDLQSIVRLADFFNVPLDYLVRGNPLFEENASVDVQAQKNTAEWFDMLADILKAGISRSELKMLLELYSLAKKKNG